MKKGKLLLTIVIFIFACTICFAQTNLETIDDVKSKYPDLDQYNEAATIMSNAVDSAHLAVSSSVGSITRIIDSFFENPNYTTEEADGRISLYQSLDITKKSSIKFRTRIKGALSLPNLSRRLKLTFTGNDDLDIDDVKEEDIENSAEKSIEAPSFGLQYSLFNRNDIDIRESSGVRFGNLSLYSGLRFRIQGELGSKWNTKLTQRIFWYTNDGWRSNTELTFNRAVGKRNLFRQTFNTVWSENLNISEGFRYTITSSFTQPLVKTAALRYHWSSIYFTQPETGWTSTTLSLRYRQRLWRDWVTLEFAPFVSWNDTSNWEANPGAAFSIALIFEGEKLTPKPHFNLDFIGKLKNPVLAEFTGNYEFYHEGKYIVLTVYIENGILMGIEPPDDPIEIKALNLEKLEFRTEEEEHEYFITFIKNKEGKISSLKWIDEDLTLFAEKIKTRDKKSEFSIKELQEDFQQMRQILEEDHANLYEYTNKETFDKLFEKQYDLIDQPMTLNEFFKLLTPITARVGCGHTNLWMPDEYWNSGYNKLFPLQIKLIEGYAVVTGDYNSKSLVPIGSIILKVNDISINDIIEEMKVNYSADAFNENFILSQIERRFSLIFARRFGYPEKFTVTYTLPGRKTRTTTELKPANIWDVRAVVFKNFNHPELEFEVLEEKSTAIMTIQTFIYYDRIPMFKAFLDSCFKDIHDKKIENLILDLRGNDGGDPFCAAPLFSYLEHEPVPYFAEPYGKYSQLAEPIPLDENRFKGNLFTLIDGRCFSTNGHFCSLLKYHKVGKFVGSEGGATYKCNAGKNMEIHLRNSRIMLFLGRSTYAAAVEGMDKTQGILPDYNVEQTYRDFIDGKDTIMNYTLELIEKSE